jgi:hypothetical protein
VALARVGAPSPLCPRTHSALAHLGGASPILIFIPAATPHPRHRDLDGRATAATPADDPARLSPLILASQLPTLAAARLLPSPAGAIDTTSATAYLRPQPPISPQPTCTVVVDSRFICAILNPSFLFDLLKREYFSLCLSRDVGMPERLGWRASAAEPVLRTLFLSCSRGCCAGNDYSNRSRQDCSVVEVLIDRVPRFSQFSKRVVRDVSAGPSNLPPGQVRASP